MGSNNYATTLDNGVLIGSEAKNIIASWAGEKMFRVLVDDGKQQYDICGGTSNFPPHPDVENNWYVGSPEQLKAAIESADEVRGLNFGNGLRGLRLMHPENEGFEFSFVVPDLDNQFRAYAAEVDEVGGAAAGSVQYDAMLAGNEFFHVMEDDGKELKHVLLGNIEASPRVENKEWLANMGTAYINTVRFGWDAPANKPDYPMWSKVKPIYGLHIKDLDGNAVWVVPQQ